MLLREAIKYQWRLTWLGDYGAGVGVTLQGKTGWKADRLDKQRIFVDVDTHLSGYNEVPAYFTSLRGHKNHWKAMGANVVYSATLTGFRMYLLYPEAITPALAEKWGWSVAWVGTTDRLLSMSEEVFAGTQRSPWHRAESKLGQPLAFTDVDTTDSGFEGMPNFITSISVASSEWEVVGAVTMGKASSTGFRLYLGIHNGGENSLAKSDDWRVNYIAFKRYSSPTPMPTPLRTRAPTPLQTPAPTPTPTTKVLVDIVVSAVGESVASFNIVRQLKFRRALASALEVGAADIVIARTAPFDDSTSPFARYAAFKSDMHTKTSIVVQCIVLTDARKARRVAQRLRATGFATLLSATMEQHGIAGAQLSIGSPVVSSVAGASPTADAQPRVSGTHGGILAVPRTHWEATSQQAGHDRAAAAGARSGATGASAAVAHLRTQLLLLAMGASAALTTLGWGSFLLMKRLRARGEQSRIHVGQQETVAITLNERAPLQQHSGTAPESEIDGNHDI